MYPRTGDVLISHGARRAAIAVRAPGAAEETELGWMDYSILKDLSADGRQILFSEQGAGGGAGLRRVSQIDRWRAGRAAGEG